jgi:hypothetical protein
MLRPVLIALGVAMVLVALAWRARDLRRRSGGIETALRSPDSSTRTRALREIASVGLRPWAAALLQRTNEVGDGVEADELVWLIGACQWEPADEPEIVQLRLWAARRLERAPDPPMVLIHTEPVEERLVEEPPVEHRVDTRVEAVVVETPRGVETEARAPRDDTAPEETRPEVVDEIEEIIGSRVLALSFVPLTVETLTVETLTFENLTFENLTSGGE